MRLITGRGLHSRGPAVLRGEVSALLEALRGRVVARVVEESGGGAFRVELQPPATPPPAARLPRDADPALQREAEAALEELGITPTPELLAAEMRRLRRQRERPPGS